jgi:ABC-type iron transport system FetAB ATPase subunit
MTFRNEPLLKVESLAAQGMAQAVSLTIQAGQVWMVRGESGSGKSQLLKALADLIEHTGQAWLNGQAQSQLTPENWRKQVMYFSAETAWWADSVGAHFEHPPTAEALSALGLDAHFLAKNPDSLSSGEKQRLALLRGLSYQPSVLLLDELTANLDEASCLKVEAYLRRYLTSASTSAPTSAARAMVWISHDSRQVQRMMTAGCECDLGVKQNVLQDATK